MATLYLTIKKQWFDEIADGKKKIEYREIKPFWDRRLGKKKYSEVYFSNGYSHDAPQMIVECKKIVKNSHYEIHLGKIIDISQ